MITSLSELGLSKAAIHDSVGTTGKPFENLPFLLYLSVVRFA
jgi:hypothetical protein